jgi:hypothetical protein
VAGTVAPWTFIGPTATVALMFIPRARLLRPWLPLRLSAGLVAGAWWLLLVVGGSLAVMRLLLPPLAAATIYDALSLTTALAIVAGTKGVRSPPALRRSP